MKKLPLIVIFIVFVLLLMLFLFFQKENVVIDPADNSAQTTNQKWRIRSIDTMKFSRDLARIDKNNFSFDKTIDLQIKAIADTGANYVAIGTPYDVEFTPFLLRWVKTARKYGLHVWFRGNFSGWEGWFGYSEISRSEHQQMLKTFILENENLFEDGDIFTSCTECENGGPGDPRQTGDVSGHRQFLIDEYIIGKEAFNVIGKQVSTNYFPMNADVASIIMDSSTTEIFGGIITIDHYVASTQDFDNTIRDLVNSSGGRIVIGELGAPIIDVHGTMTEDEQAKWISDLLTILQKNPDIIGINYWTSFGGSTEIWKKDGSPTQAVNVITNFFKK